MQLALAIALTACTTSVPVHWDVHKQAAPRITIPDPEFDSGDASAGRRAFIAVGCIECHRVAEDPELPTAVTSANEALLQNLTRYAPNQLAQRITSANTGGRAMKLSSQPLTTKQLVDIVKYLRSPRNGLKS